MTQELIDLRNSILQGRYEDALAIVDELEGMSKLANLRQIQSFLKILSSWLQLNIKCGMGILPVNRLEACSTI